METDIQRGSSGLKREKEKRRDSSNGDGGEAFVCILVQVPLTADSSALEQDAEPPADMSQ